MMTQHKLTEQKLLSHLLEGMCEVSSSGDLVIPGLSSDSGKIQSGDLFLALPGIRHNGTEFIEEALEAGASAVLIDTDIAEADIEYDVPVFCLNDLARRTGIIADRFYDHPSASLNVVGITGTNGKTSVGHFIAQALNYEKVSAVGLLGTLGNGVYGKLKPSKHTTMDAISIQKELADLRDSGVSDLVMEVSSHALAQHRVAGVNFDLGIFTNLSREHLDYHGDMESYGSAKSQLFRNESLKTAIINIDDEFGRALFSSLSPEIHGISYGLSQTYSDSKFHVCGRILNSELGNLTLYVTSPWGEGELKNRVKW